MLLLNITDIMVDCESFRRTPASHPQADLIGAGECFRGDFSDTVRDAQFFQAFAAEKAITLDFLQAIRKRDFGKLRTVRE